MATDPTWFSLLGDVFQGDGFAVAEYLKAVPSRYTYILHRPDGRPFYVGQGQGVRLLQHVVEARRPAGAKVSNPYKCNVIRQYAEIGLEIYYRIDALHTDASGPTKPISIELVKQLTGKDIADLVARASDRWGGALAAKPDALLV